MIRVNGTLLVHCHFTIWLTFQLGNSAQFLQRADPNCVHKLVSNKSDKLLTSETVPEHTRHTCKLKVIPNSAPGCSYTTRRSRSSDALGP